MSSDHTYRRQPRPMPKLTLSADRQVIEQAKRLAAAEGSSVSALFARFVGELAVRQAARAEAPPVPPGPLTRRLSGIARVPDDLATASDRELLERALAERHGLP